MEIYGSKGKSENFQRVSYVVIISVMEVELSKYDFL